MGCVLGFLFVSFKDHIPGSSVVRKSLVFSLILLAISSIFSLRGFFDPNVAKMFGSNAFFHIQMASYAIALIEYPLIGCLFGYLLDQRLKRMHN